MPLTCGKCPLWEWGMRSVYPDDPDRKCIVDDRWHRPSDEPQCEDDLLALRDAVDQAIAMREAEERAQVQ